MKNVVTSLFRFVLQWFRSARRAQPQERITPEQLRKALTEMLADPQTRRLLLEDLMGPVFPIQGGQVVCKSAREISAGDFGADCGGGVYTFPSRMGAVAFGIGSYLMPTGAPNSYRLGLGMNLYWNGAKWIATGDGANNGASAVLGKYGPASLTLFLIPSTGGANQEILDANLAQYAQLSIDPAGNVGIGPITPGHKLDVLGTIRALSAGAAIGSYLMPHGAAGNSFRLGLGMNLYWDGANWIAKGDGVSNGAAAVLGNYGPAALTLFVIPSTSGADKAISNASLADYARLSIDSAGNVTIGNLNKMVYLRPRGPGLNDSDQINNAIAALPFEGGIIMLEPGEYRIETQISITRNGVKLRGYGGAWPASPCLPDPPGTFGNPLTKLLWAGSPTDPEKVVIKLKPATANTNIQDLEISDLTIDGAETAEIGLLLDRVMTSNFRSVHVRRMKDSLIGEGIRLTTTASGLGGSGIDCAWNLFENCSVICASNGVVLMSDATGGAAANTSHNTFVGLSVQFRGARAEDAGIRLRDCDNNFFNRTYVQRISGPAGPGIGVLVENPALARSNYFYHVQVPAGPGFGVTNATTPPNNKNLIFGYDLENGQGQPTSTPDTNAANYLFWIDSKGKIRGGQLL